MHQHTPAKIVRLGKLKVDWGRDWHDLIFRSGKNSHPDLYLFQVGDQYKSSRAGIKESEVVLLGFQGAWRKEVAMERLSKEGLRVAHPRVAFAVGENMGSVLPQMLGMPVVAVVSLMTCEFRIRDNEVSFVTKTLIYPNLWQESRLVPASYIFEPFCWVLAEDNTNA